MPITDDEVRQVLDTTLSRFLTNEVQEILEGVNERSNCGRLAIYMHETAQQYGIHEIYLVDVEYNRKQQGQIKTIMNGKGRVVRVNCDVILHSRGVILNQDNLIAVEVKKVDRPYDEKQKDRERLRALTKTHLDDFCSGDGRTPPEHVCGYMLGVFIELDRFNFQCKVEYYRKGRKFEEASIPFGRDIIAQQVALR
ncbi:hypothetical protein [Limnobacter sp. MED105]|uniref:hypothetical protein n=1 Tax=Limnobacter sp. MED105 TaxID=391597 RepID=UPI000156C512|nr:hypothetical protein [Limnobacter sp. MED105]EDM84313.1 hypothetical protein LMED105_02083 [Limnobacter sp. MED105]